MLALGAGLDGFPAPLVPAKAPVLVVAPPSASPGSAIVLQAERLAEAAQERADKLERWRAWAMLANPIFG